MQPAPARLPALRAAQGCLTLCEALFVAPVAGKRPREGVWEFLRAVGVRTGGALLSFVATLIAARWRRQALALRTGVVTVGDGSTPHRPTRVPILVRSFRISSVQRFRHGDAVNLFSTPKSAPALAPCLKASLGVEPLCTQRGFTADLAKSVAFRLAEQLSEYGRANALPSEVWPDIDGTHLSVGGIQDPIPNDLAALRGNDHVLLGYRPLIPIGSPPARPRSEFGLRVVSSAKLPNGRDLDLA